MHPGRAGNDEKREYPPANFDGAPPPPGLAASRGSKLPGLYGARSKDECQTRRRRRTTTPTSAYDRSAQTLGRYHHGRRTTPDTNPHRNKS